ncbi:MAG: hypothetical protein ABIK62_01250 [candidate division WOR-3 bacterium]
MSLGGDAPYADPSYIAKELLDRGNPDGAILEFLRFICFSTDSGEIAEAYVGIAHGYERLGMPEAAIAAQLMAVAYSQLDSVRDERRIDLALLQFSCRHLSAAEIELLRVANFSRYSVVRRRAGLFLGICNLYTGRWGEARQALHAALACEEPVWAEVDSLLAQAERARPKSPSRARWLSTFLPGAGQAYVGDWRNALNALILNSATGYFLAYCFLSRDWVTGLFTGLSLFQRYYLGQRQSAAELAERHNQRENARHTGRVLRALAPRTGTY